MAYGLYGLLGAVRYSINEQQQDSSPETSGLFYLAPGMGFLFGSVAGGWLSDRTVKRFLKVRNGLRIPSDRLRDAFKASYLVTPVGTILFGWGLEKHAGGLYLPGVAAAIVGTGYMATFAVVNTYGAGESRLNYFQFHLGGAVRRWLILISILRRNFSFEKEPDCQRQVHGSVCDGSRIHRDEGAGYEVDRIGVDIHHWLVFI